MQENNNNNNNNPQINLGKEIFFETHLKKFSIMWLLSVFEIFYRSYNILKKRCACLNNNKNKTSTVIVSNEKHFFIFWILSLIFAPVNIECHNQFEMILLWEDFCLILPFEIYEDEQMNTSDKRYSLYRYRYRYRYWYWYRYRWEWNQEEREKQNKNIFKKHEKKTFYQRCWRIKKSKRRGFFSKNFEVARNSLDSTKKVEVKTKNCIQKTDVWWRHWDRFGSARLEEKLCMLYHSV